jgi:hypothetical protein
MAISLKQTDVNSIPIGKEVGAKRIIYLNKEEKEAEPITRRTYDGKKFECKQCGRLINTINGYKYHITKVCVIKDVYDIETKREIDPIPTEKRQVIYIAGAQDSGKSYRVMKYIYYWRQLFSERKIIMVSRLATDETFTKSEFGNLEEGIIRLKPNIQWIKEKFQLEDFQNCLVVFDDIVSSNWSDNPDPKASMKENKMIQDYVRDLALDIVQNGRHENIHIIVTNHDLYDSHNTSKLLKDATDFVIFPGTTGAHHLDYFLRNYCGLLKKQIMRVMTIKSRWILIHKNDPKYIMHSHGVYRYDILGMGGTI